MRVEEFTEKHTAHHDTHTTGSWQLDPGCSSVVEYVLTIYKSMDLSPPSHQKKTEKKKDLADQSWFGVEKAATWLSRNENLKQGGWRNFSGLDIESKILYSSQGGCGVWANACIRDQKEHHWYRVEKNGHQKSSWRWWDWGVCTGRDSWYLEGGIAKV